MPISDASHILSGVRQQLAGGRAVARRRDFAKPSAWLDSHGPDPHPLRSHGAGGVSMSRGARISAVVGSVLAGAVLGLIGYMFLTNAPVYQHQYYRDANEWFGLRFFLELPIMACLFALLFGLI